MDRTTGPRELHVTFAPEGPEGELKALAARHGAKLTAIELSSGLWRTQHMLTLETEETVEAAVRRAEALGRELAAAGFPVLRTKVESSPFDQENPRTPEAARAADRAGRYHEWHVKVRTSAGQDEAALRAVVRRHGAKFSANARKSAADGTVERFVTGRAFGAVQDQADQACAGLVRDLGAVCAVAEVDREFVVHDSCMALDQGWEAP